VCGTSFGLAPVQLVTPARRRISSVVRPSASYWYQVVPKESERLNMRPSAHSRTSDPIHPPSAVFNTPLLHILVFSKCYYDFNGMVHPRHCVAMSQCIK
jgi:hypothetical protein